MHGSVILAWTNKILKERGTEETPFSRGVCSEPAGPGVLPCLPLVLLVIFVLLKISLNTLDNPGKSKFRLPFASFVFGFENPKRWEVAGKDPGNGSVVEKGAGGQGRISLVSGQRLFRK